jgi:5'-deoxynucleotidase YfbR-like HD superfamily hydrolase
MGNIESLQREQVAYEVGFDAGMNDGRPAIELIDQIITQIYLPFRGQEGYCTERAIYIEPPYARHKENDAEHSWHLAFTVQALWDNCQDLGLYFHEDFDISKALMLAIVHDVPEIWSADVDLATPHQELVRFKHSREKAAMDNAREALPFLAGTAIRWERYENKDTAEARFVSDIDKILGVRQIYLDGGKRWRNWEGFGIDCEKHSDILRNKLLTPAGHAMFDAIEADFDKHPNMFAPFSGPVNEQGTLF